MENKYKHRIDLLFFVLIVTLIFSPIPKPINLEILGATGKEFAIYPLGIGLLFMVYSYVVLRKKVNLMLS